eukprot:753571-Hanusia_phi.AAC.13
MANVYAFTIAVVGVCDVVSALRSTRQAPTVASRITFHQVELDRSWLCTKTHLLNRLLQRASRPLQAAQHHADSLTVQTSRSEGLQNSACRIDGICT